MNNLTFNDIINECLVAIFSNDLLSKEFYLKGGQAIRLGENIDKRMSIDIDFSASGKINKIHLNALKEALTKHFKSLKFELFDYTWERKPKTIKTEFPDWWQGYAASFKLIEQKNQNLGIEEKRRKALRPTGAQGSSKIKIDISPYEYCEIFTIYEIKGVKAKRYSTPLLIMEKLRAICQQHPDAGFK